MLGVKAGSAEAQGSEAVRVPTPGPLAPNRTPIGGLLEPARLREPGRVPWRVVPLLLLLVAAVGLVGWNVARQPHDISDVVLTGARSPAPLDVVLLLDESASFMGYAPVREEAVRRLAEWAPANLRPDDTVTIVGFAADAVVRLEPTRVSELGGSIHLSSTPVDGESTDIRPALLLSASAAPRHGSVRTVVAITDTIVSDADGAGELIASLDAPTMSVVTPVGVGVTGEWREAFAWQAAFTADSGSAGSTSLAIAGAIAHATGQEVKRR